MRRLLWPGILFVLIGSVVTLDVTMIIVAGADPAFDVQAGAEDGDAAWAAERARAEAERLLGWNVEPAVASFDGAIEFDVSVTTRDGAAVDGATVTVEAFHNANPREVYRMPLISAGDGEFSGALDASRPGKWRYRLFVERGEDRVRMEGVHAHDWSGE